MFSKDAKENLGVTVSELGNEDFCYQLMIIAKKENVELDDDTIKLCNFVLYLDDEIDKILEKYDIERF